MVKEIRLIVIAFFCYDMLEDRDIIMVDYVAGAAKA